MFASSPFLIMLLPMAFSAVLIYAVVRFVRAFRKAKSENASVTLRYNVISLVCVGISLFSWLFNMGWIRVILVWTGIPALHCALFLLAAFKTAEIAQRDRRIIPIVLLSGITYFLPYWILPDGGDMGGAYLLMGLVTDEAVIGALWYVAGTVAVGNAFLLVIMLIMATKNRKNSNIGV